MKFTSEDLSKNFSNFEIIKVLQNCLLVTVGDQLKQLAVDHEGNVVQASKQKTKKLDKFYPLNQVNTAAISDHNHEGIKMDPQFTPKFFGENIKTVHYVAEADNHGLFEIRFHELDHLNPRDFLEKTGKTVRMPGASRAAKEAALLWEKFASLSTYYNEVNKICYNVCPAFYKFKIAPFQALFSRAERVPAGVEVDNVSDSNLGSDQRSAQGGSVFARSLGDAKPDCINRVYEVEEHMGGDFIDELARMNRDHLKLQEHAQN